MVAIFVYFQSRDYADKAEKSHHLTYIAKSNSLRLAAKDIQRC